LAWATAQPLTAIDDGSVRTVFFAETEGVSPQFAFDTNGPAIEALTGHLKSAGSLNVLSLKPGVKIAARIQLPDGRSLQLVVLDYKSSLAVWKGTFQDRDRVFLTRAGLVLDGETLRLTATSRDDLKVDIYPAPPSLADNGQNLESKSDGIFQRFAAAAPPSIKSKATFTLAQPAGPLRKIPLGTIEQPVATAPLDADFAQAAIWKIKIPADVDLGNDPLLRIHYVGDVARVILDGKFITDDFYNGRAFEIGLRRHAPEILNGDLRIAILPLQKSAPIYMADQARPNFGKADSVATIQSIEIVPRFQSQLTARRALTGISD
jgi:beta-galactosidase